MKKTIFTTFIGVVALVGISSLPSFAVTRVNKEKANDHQLKDASEQSDKAARVFTEIMNAPDKAIPVEILDKAECVAVFPSVIKAGFVVGGRGGRGVVS